jgi:hypothetical protein
MRLQIHHTGHDKPKSYGTSTREWQLDTVLRLEEVERENADVCFNLIFQKARLRTPLTRMNGKGPKMIAAEPWPAASRKWPLHADPLQNHERR